MGGFSAVTIRYLCVGFSQLMLQLPESSDLRRKAHAAGIVWRCLTEIPGERPTDIGDAAIIAARGLTTTADRRVRPSRAAVV